MIHQRADADAIGVRPESEEFILHYGRYGGKTERIVRA